MSKKEKHRFLKKLKRICRIGKDFLEISKAIIASNFVIIDRAGMLEYAVPSKFTGIVFIKKNKIIVFYKEGLIHRKGGPAVINNKKRVRAWYKHGIIQRKNKPAMIYYDKKWNIIQEHYYKNGVLHREDGPAVIDYHKEYKYPFKAYYLDGQELTEDEHYFRCTATFINLSPKLTDAKISDII